MSAPNDPPLTRREARRLQRLAEEAAAASTGGQQADPGLGSAPGSGSAASGASAGEQGGDPLAYRTQVRPAIPRFEPATVGSASAPGSGSVVSAPARPDSVPDAPLAPWASAPGSFRRRDFAPSTPNADTPQSFATERPDQPLDYHTQGRSPFVPVPDLVEPAEPPIMHDSVPASAPDRPLSRRELRAIAAEEVEAEPGEPAVAEADPVDVDVRSEEPAATVAPAPDSPPAPAILPGEAAAPHAPQVSSHWSVGVHDDEDPFTNTFSRQVGSAATSTNALVLPEMPRGDLAGPVAGTGEIIITGMIDVPSSVASTGAVPSVHDSPDIDDLFDVDTEYASTDSAPVSAISAVSSHTGTRDVMGGRKARRTSVLTTVLVSSTVVLAVVAVALFVVAAVNGLF